MRATIAFRSASTTEPPRVAAPVDAPAVLCVPADSRECGGSVVCACAAAASSPTPVRVCVEEEEAGEEDREAEEEAEEESRARWQEEITRRSSVTTRSTEPAGTARSALPRSSVT